MGPKFLPGRRKWSDYWDRLAGAPQEKRTSCVLLVLCGKNGGVPDAVLLFITYVWGGSLQQ